MLIAVSKHNITKVTNQGLHPVLIISLARFDLPHSSMCILQRPRTAVCCLCVGIYSKQSNKHTAHVCAHKPILGPGRVFANIPHLCKHHKHMHRHMQGKLLRPHNTFSQQLVLSGTASITQYCHQDNVSPYSNANQHVTNHMTCPT
jgi:hypothetical protein